MVTALSSGQWHDQCNHLCKYTITNSDLNRPCFAWYPYGKSGLFKTELVIGSGPLQTQTFVCIVLADQG